MDLWASLLLLAPLLLIILAYGSTRLRVPRKVGIEGIEDPEAAKAYDRISRMPQFSLLRNMFVAELKKHDPKGTITDIGCGPGYLLEVMGRELPGIRLRGIDISPEMIEKARGNLASKGMGDRVEFQQGEAGELPFEDSTQDFLVSTLSLHHWSDPQGAMEEFYRVLKPGGQVLIFDMRRDATRAFYGLILFAQHIALRFLDVGAIRRVNEPIGSLLASYTPDELKKMLSKTPFVDFRIDGGLGWMYVWCKKPN